MTNEDFEEFFESYDLLLDYVKDLKGHLYLNSKIIDKEPNRKLIITYRDSIKALLNEMMTQLIF
jgi:hypothetical protein